MAPQICFESTKSRTMWRCVVRGAPITICLASSLFGQKVLTWEQTKQEFKLSSPTLRAARIAVQQSRADEITAYLRPNPVVTLSLDQFTPTDTSPYRPTSNVLPEFAAEYLVERRHKRALRRDSARQETAISQSELAD